MYEVIDIDGEHSYGTYGDYASANERYMDVNDQWGPVAILRQNSE
jgi:hypothetical protein